MKLQRYIPSVVVLALAAGPLACGMESDATCDVRGTDPSEGGDISIYGVFSISFDCDIDATTLTTITATQPNGAAWIGSRLSTDGPNVVESYSPATGGFQPDRYVVTIPSGTSGIRGQQGEVLTEDILFSFHVPYP